MSYSAPVPNMHHHAISTFDLDYACLAQGPLWYQSPGSALWYLQYGAIYIPVRIKRSCVIRKLGIANGAGPAGNFDLGLYDAAGTRLVSTGSTAQSGTNTEQVIDVTDTTVGPGLYYLAACFDNSNSSTIMRLTINAPQLLATGVLTQTLASVVLPATATWVANQTVTMYPVLFAFLGTTVA